MAIVKNGRQITEWIKASEDIPTTSGPMKAKDWCAKQVEIMRRNGKSAEVQEGLNSGRKEYCVVQLYAQKKEPVTA